MQLTRQTDFGLRTLIYLALQPAQRVPVAEVARAFGMSHNHLLKVTHKLAAAGMINSHRGKGGGISLAGSPEAIRIGAVVEVLEERRDMVDCQRPLCPVLPACRLKQVLEDARDAFLARLDDCTLGDLVDQRQEELRGLLNPAADTGPQVATR